MHDVERRDRGQPDVLFRNLTEWAANLGIVGVPADSETTSSIQVRKATIWTQLTDMQII